jgi:hypothetical protein
MGKFNFFDGLKSMISSMTNDRNPSNTNVIVAPRVSDSGLREIYKTGIGNKIVRTKSGYALKNDF